MRDLLAASTLILAVATVGASAQSPSDNALAPTPPPGRNLTATGKTMPPATGRTNAPISASIEAEMIKAQKAAEARNKAWDDKMRRTMSTICTGC